MATQGQRIEANCKIVWGSYCDYDLEVDTDEYEHYWGWVRRDFGDSMGPLLLGTGPWRSEDATWDALDKMLGAEANAVVAKRQRQEKK